MYVGNCIGWYLRSSLRVVQSWTHPSANQDLRLPTLIPILMDIGRRFCNFIDALEGDFSKEAVVLKWTEAFVNEDKRFLG